MIQFCANLVSNERPYQGANWEILKIDKIRSIRINLRELMCRDEAGSDEKNNLT